MKFNLISYGLGDRFDENLFMSIKNEDSIKPDGGLWASPVDSEYGWKDCCEGNKLNKSLSSKFEFVYEGRTLVINSLDDLDNIIWRKVETNGCILYFPDYEAMLSNGIDAIYITINGEIETSSMFAKPNLWGYDCECIIIMNPKCINNN